MTHSYGAPQKAGGSAEVAGARVGDVVIATDRQLGLQRYWAGGHAAHDTVGTVSLVRHTGVGTRAHHVGARLFAFSLVHDLQIRVALTAGHQQSTLITVGLPIAPTHSMLYGDVSAVRRTHTLRTSNHHLTHLPWAAFHTITGLFAEFAGHDSQEAQQADLIDGQTGVGPGRV